jgi:hypothetical protein
MIAKKNISVGPIIQLSNNETLNILVFLNTSPIFSYLTFANGGYIINIKPMANGILVVPLENELINCEESGKKYPMLIPTNIAIKIQSVKKRSRKFSFFLCTGLQFIALIHLLVDV